MSERQLMVKILGDAEGAKKAMAETGDSAGGLAGHMKGLAEVIGTALAVGAVIDFGKKCVEKFTEVATATRNLQIITGDSATSMSALNFAAGESGVSTDSLASAMTKFEKAVVKANSTDQAKIDKLDVANVKYQEQIDKLDKLPDKHGKNAASIEALQQKIDSNNVAISAMGGAFDKLGFQSTDVNGKLKDTHQMLMDVADKFQSMPDGPEKTAEALKLFGKGVGPDFIAMLDKGRAGIGDLEAEAAKFGLVISQDQVDAMQKNKEASRKMHAAWEGLQVMIGSKLMPVISALTGWIAEHLPAAMAFLKDKIDQLNPLFDAMKNFVMAIISYFEAHPDVLKGVGIALGVIAAAVIAINMPLLALIAIAFGVYEAFTHWDEIKKAIPGVLSNLEGIAKKVWEWIEVQAPIFAKKLEVFAAELWKWVQPQILPMLGELGKLLIATTEWVYGTALPAIITKLAEWGKALWAWVQPQIVPMLKELGALLEQLGAWARDVALPAIGLKLEEWGKAFWKWIGPKIIPMLEELGKLLLAMQEWLFGTALPAIVKKLGEWALEFIKWVGPQIPPLLLELGKLLLALGEWLITTALPAIVSKLAQWAVEFVKWVGPQIPPMLLELAKLLLALGEWVLQAIPTLILKLAQWTLQFTVWIAQAAINMLPELAKLLASLVSWLFDTGVTLGIKALELSKQFLGWIADAVTKIPAEAEKLAIAVVNFVGGLPPRIASAAAGMWDGIGTAFRGALNMIIKWWDGLKFPGFTIPLPNIMGGDVTVGAFGAPYIAPIGFAGGGITPGSYGDIAGVVHGNEMVLNPSQQANLWNKIGGDGGGMGGATYNVTVQVAGSVMAAQDLARTLADEMTAMTRRGVLMPNWALAS